MTAEMKYVVVNSAAGEQLFVFPKNIDHDAFAEVLSYIKRTDTDGNWNRSRRAPVSAGFTDGLTCYGHSDTLRLKSRSADTALLKQGGAV